ncbi:MAG: DUF6015 family protein [Thermoplasmata archaeon]
MTAAGGPASDDLSRTVTEEELTLAITRTLVAHGRIPESEAAPTARMVLGYFGPDESVLDNTLQGEDRDRFYWLEDEGLITSQEEDATVSQGRSWRIHYWILQKGRIREVARPPRPAQVASEAEVVYASMNDRDWRHNGGGASGSSDRA